MQKRTYLTVKLILLLAVFISPPLLAETRLNSNVSSNSGMLSASREILISLDVTPLAKGSDVLNAAKSAFAFPLKDRSVHKTCKKR